MTLNAVAGSFAPYTLPTMDIRLCLPCGYAAPPPAVECPHCGAALEVRDERWLVGQTLGSYRIERIIGSGGMGVVFGARHEALLREAAIKVLQPELGSGSGGSGGDADAFARRFLQEARLLAALEHPGIVGIYDFAVSPFGFPYLVMPLLRGETLRELMRRHPEGLPPAWIAAIVQDLCEALGYAHAHGVVHRDLKPENVFLGAEGQRAWTRLLDFGIAHSQRRDALDRTMTGVLMGTPLYLAPEQLRGEPVSPATDQYSLALLVIELLDGRAVRAGESLTAIMRRYAEAPLPPASLPAGLEPAQARALSRATDPQPSARFPDLTEFRKGLELPAPDRAALADALQGEVPAEADPAATAVMATPLPAPAALSPTTPVPRSAVASPPARADRRAARSGLWRIVAMAAVLVLLAAVWMLRPVTPAPAPEVRETVAEPEAAAGWLRAVDAVPLPGALGALAQINQTLVLRQAGGWMLFDLGSLTAAPGTGLARGERLIGADDEKRLWLLHEDQIDALNPVTGVREQIATAESALDDAGDRARWTMAAGGEWLARVEPARVVVFRVVEGRVQHWMEREAVADTRVALGARIAVLAGPRGQLEAWDLEARERLWQRDLPAFRVNALAVSEPLGHLALASEDAIQVHSLRDGELQARLPSTAVDLAWFADGPRLAAADGRRLRLWEWRGGKLVQNQEIEGGSWLYRGIAQLISGGGGMLHRYAFGEALELADAGVGPVWSAVAAGGYAYLGGASPTVARLAPGAEPLRRQLHDDGVPDLRVHDGRLVSASDDRTLAVWRLPELEPLWRARGHDFMINQIGLGVSVWTASSDGRLRRWRWPELEPAEDVALRARVDPQLELHALWVASDDSELLAGTWNRRLLRLRRGDAGWALSSAAFAAHVGYRMVELAAIDAVLVVGVSPGRLAVYDRRSGALTDLPRIGRDCLAAAGDGSGRGAWLGCEAALVHVQVIERDGGGFALRAATLESTALGQAGALALLPAADASGTILVWGNDAGQVTFLPAPEGLPLRDLGPGSPPRAFAPVR